MSSGLDTMDEVTRRYIRLMSNRMIDNIFSSSPLASYLRDITNDDYDDFTEWAREVRKEADIDDGPREHSYRGGQNITENFTYGTSALAEVLDNPTTWDSAAYATYKAVDKKEKKV